MSHNQSLLFIILIVALSINPFICIGNLSRHHNLPPHPVFVFETDISRIQTLHKILANFRDTPPMPLLQKSEAMYQVKVPNLNVSLEFSRNIFTQTDLSFGLFLRLSWSALSKFMLSVKQTELRVPDKPPQFSLS